MRPWGYAYVWLCPTTKTDEQRWWQRRSNSTRRLDLSCGCSPPTADRDAKLEELTVVSVGGDRRRREPNCCVAASCHGARAQGEAI
jgi:hypothetical protein